ncbi:hypothetical protein E2C01_071702 [Portunus trituberculatus]|uniref:Uncharacterized protein n=1 Tax=Portunus trituberculatus TaxID=210409 RepID=A0A5B7HW00_PORTR|nr:hypothetical protein [Portunus trituberculatus]
MVVVVVALPEPSARISQVTINGRCSCLIPEAYKEDTSEETLTRVEGHGCLARGVRVGEEYDAGKEGKRNAKKKLLNNIILKFENY